jgi:hypothetical protein
MWSDFMTQFLASTFENWQSEWLQLIVQGILLLGAKHWLFQVDAEDMERMGNKVHRIAEELGMDPTRKMGPSCSRSLGRAPRSHEACPVRGIALRRRSFSAIGVLRGGGFLGLLAGACVVLRADDYSATDCGVGFLVSGGRRLVGIETRCSHRATAARSSDSIHGVLLLSSWCRPVPEPRDSIP